MGPEEDVQVQFYLLLATIRTSRYQDMKNGLKTLFKSFKKSQESSSKFYLLQAMALIRYYKGEFMKASEIAQKAFKEALTENDNYLCMLANDLLAHSYCMQSQYGKGLMLFDESLRFAKKISNNTNVSIIELAKTIYKIEAGWDLAKEEHLLEKWIDSIKPHDYYTLNDALILKAKYLQLKGKLHQAENLLIKLGKSIYSYHFSRQILSYNLTLARLSIVLDGPSKALGIIGTSLKLCSQGEDYYFLQKFFELEAYLNGKQDDRATNKNLEFYRKKTGLPPISIRFPLSIAPEEIIEKNLKVEKPTIATIKHLEKSNLLGLLFMTGKYKHKNFIDFRFGQKSVLMSIEGDLYFLQGLTTGQFELLSILVERPHWSREELFETYWGVSFDEFLHANKYYVTLKRLKKALNLDRDIFSFKKGDIIMHTFHLYKREHKNEERTFRLHTDKNLNPRQLRFLESAQQDYLFTPMDYGKIFQISRNTISRDLSTLCKEGFIIRKGSKRGTYYMVC